MFPVDTRSSPTTTTRHRRILGAMALAGALTPALITACAVSVSSSHGSGTQFRTATYNNGAKVNGTLKSTSGITVYYHGRVTYPQIYCSATNIGRYSTDTTSLTPVTRGGTITSFPGIGCNGADVQSRVSRNIPNFPDTSGKWSTKY